MADRVDPYRSSRFLLEIDGVTQAGFSECSIPASTQDPIEYREGNEAFTVRKIPGLNKYDNLTLKWGTTDSLDVYNWRKQVEDCKLGEARRTVAVLMLDDAMKPTARWEFYMAWPTKYEAPDLNATSDEIAIETLEIAHEGMVRTK